MTRKERVLLLVAALSGLGWVLYKGGGPILDPRHSAWLHAGDWSWHHLGWLYYHLDGWHLPLGRIANFPDPAGTVSGYVDAIPWLALLLKLLPRRAPEDFQYLGPWLGACFALQGLWGAKLVGLFSPRPALRLLGAAFYIAAPVLLFRVGHAALCAQWLLLAMLWLYLRPSSTAEQRHEILRGTAWVLVAAAGIHPYLTVMVFGLAVALLVRLWRYDGLPGRRIVKLGLGYLGLVAATFGLLGFFDGTGPTSDGFGLYSADLLALINPLGRSRWFPAFPVGPGQYEGFAYLGAGVLGLVALALGALGTRRVRWRWQPLLPLLCACGALAAYSLSLRITVAGRVLFSSKFTWFYLATIFQSSGRFIWPLYYLVLTGALWATVQLWQHRPRRLLAGLALALLVQVYEQQGILIAFATTPPPAPAAGWQLASGAYRTLILYPPDLTGNGGTTYPDGYTTKLGYLAYRHGLTINSAMLSRRNSRREESYCQALRTEVEQGHLQRDAIYLVDPASLPLFAHAVCGRLDGYQVCVSGEQKDPFAALLAGSAGPPNP